MAPRTAELHIVHTSSTCVCYQLLDAAGQRLWSNRVEPHEAGHAGARRRMAAWALAHRITIVARQDGPDVIERRAVTEVAGMAMASSTSLDRSRR
jgi:hypothetical protein